LALQADRAGEKTKEVGIGQGGIPCPLRENRF